MVPWVMQALNLIEKIRKKEKVKNASVVKIAKKNGLISLSKD